MNTRLVLLSVLLMTSAQVHAVFRCQVGNRIVYQDVPCDTGSIAKELPRAAAPAQADQYLAKARALRDQAALSEIEIRKLREDQAAQRHARKQAECNRRARDLQWTEATAKNNKNDKWWQNQAINDRERFAEDCW